MRLLRLVQVDNGIAFQLTPNQMVAINPYAVIENVDSGFGFFLVHASVSLEILPANGHAAGSRPLWYEMRSQALQCRSACGP